MGLDFDRFWDTFLIDSKYFLWIGNEKIMSQFYEIFGTYFSYNLHIFEKLTYFDIYFYLKILTSSQ